MMLKKILGTLLAIALISFSAHAGNEQLPENLIEKNEFSLAQCLQKAGSTYAVCAEKMKPLYNPAGIAAVAVSSAALGAKRFAFFSATGGLVYANFDRIQKGVEKYNKLSVESLERK